MVQPLLIAKTGHAELVMADVKDNLHRIAIGSAKRK
jgi:hypothetical protein